MIAVPAFCMECGKDAPCGLHGGALVFAVGEYSGVSRELVHAMKYENGRSMAILMGELMASRIGRPSVDFLIPIPLHKSSERDYNQAELMARGAGGVWNIKTISALRWDLSLPRQALKPGSSERFLPEGAMTTTYELMGTNVFIVDDVYTSGSTIRAAARALERAGSSVAGAMVWSKARRRS
jgi:predicted amidophosphoribosyltransferase